MNKTFTLFEVTADSFEIDGQSISDYPVHTNDYEELIIVVEGAAQHFIDFGIEKMEAPFVSFVTRGKIHKLTPLTNNGTCKILALRFKSEFLPENTFKLYSHYHERKPSI